MSVSKDEFVKIMEQRIKSDPNQLNIPNAQLVKFVNDFVDKNGRKRLGWDLNNYMLGIAFGFIPYIWTSIFGTKQIVCTFDHGKDIDLGKLHSHLTGKHAEWMKMNINDEVPIFFHDDGAIHNTCLLMTNKAIYYHIRKSHKTLREGEQTNMGITQLADIEQFEATPHSFSQMITLSINGQDIGAFNCGDGTKKSANNLRKLFQSLLMNKASYIG